MTELEKKLLLTKDAYDCLMEHFGYENPLLQKPTIKQINYYFDSDDLSMNRQNITCRIRLKDGKYKGTLKQHTTASDYSTEIEMEVHDGIHDNAFTDMGLKLQGKLITERCVIFQNAACKAVLDKNDYLGYTDYELELEYSPGHEKDARDFLQMTVDTLRRKCFLAYKHYAPSVPSKSTRFFGYLATKDQREQ